MEFIRYCKNHFKYKFFKILLYLLIGILLYGLSSSISIAKVNAEVLYDYEGRLLNRSYDAFPFSTNYTSGEVTTYNNSNYVKLYGTNPQLNNPPRYLYVVYCATGKIDFNTTGSVTYGNLSNNGSTIGGTCSTQGYSGNYYLNRWTIYDWYDASSSGTYEWLLQWNIKISNTLSYTIFVTVDSMFLSNELITDFGDSALLAEILQQNNSLRSSINSIQSSVDSTNDSLSGVESAQQETNDKLDTTIQQNEEAENTRKGIWQTIKDLPNAFLNMLKSLFIPEDDYFSNWFDDLQAFLEQKLGFLATPFTLLIDFINLYLNFDSSSDIIINIPNISVPNFEDTILIKAQSFNWSELLKSKSSLLMLWNLYLDFIDVFLILNFIGLCENTYARIFGGDTSSYEYYTVEDSFTYDNSSGEVLSSRRNERTTTKRRVE